MRRWLWSIILGIIGVLIVRQWVDEQEATRATLKEDDLLYRAPAKPNTATTSNPPSAAAPTTEPAPNAVQSDALTEINGIGATFEQALNEIGITTFEQLAAQTPESLAERIGGRLTAERIIRDAWIEQAQQLANANKPNTQG